MASSQNGDLAPLALSVLGLRSSDLTAPLPRHLSSPHARLEGVRRTSYYSSFQTRCSPCTDGPPSYAVSQRLSRTPRAPSQSIDGQEVLPEYNCTVLREGVMSMRIEKLSPFQCLPKQQWRSVYVILRGTQLCIYKIKTSSFGSESMAGPGKLIRRYTLQHAEIGLANDVNESLLIPVSKLAHLIPSMARRKAFEKDPELFRSVRQFAIRLRLENDQLLLAESKEESIFRWVNSLAAGMDIAHPIDERSLPKQCTIPRRQRQRRQASSQLIDNLQDRRLIQEQEQILRDMYPAFARSIDEAPQNTLQQLQQSETVDASAGGAELTLTATNMIDQEAEDVDLTALAEDAPVLQASISRPVNSRQTTASSNATSSETMSSTNPHHFDEHGKWAPIHPHTPRAQFRYIRRCMPILLFDSPRASSIIVCNGRRLHINYKMDMLEEWTLTPPTYDSHKWEATPGGDALERTQTRTSTAETVSLAQSGSDTIETMQTPQSGDPNLEIAAAGLEKSQTRTSSDAQKRDQQLPAPSPQHHHGSKTSENMEAIENAPATQPTPIFVGC